MAFTYPSVGVQLAPTSSAGVFDANGNLVRTLWSATVNDPRAANPVAAWDGTLDDISVVAPTGNYTIKLLTNDVQYEWEGVVGNSSADHTSTSAVYLSNNQEHTSGGYVLNYYHAYESQISNMCITASGEMYFATEYDERLNVMHVARESNPQYANGILNQFFRASLIGNGLCCTDSINTYFAWNGRGTNTSSVWAVVCQTKIPYVFSSPDSTGGGILGYNFYFLDVVGPGDGSEFIDDIAVQTSGNFLFIARPLTNTIYSRNKTTGAAASTFTTYVNPDAIDCNPVTGDLWVSHLVNSATTNSTFDALTTTSQWVLSGGNLTATITAVSGTANVAYSTGTSSGKFYFEIIINSNGGVSFGLPVGVASTLGTHNFGIGFDANTAGYYGDGTFNVNSVHTGGYATFGNGDNVSIACDSAGSLIWFRVNGGNWNNSPSANPATATGGISIAGIGSTFYAAIAAVAGGTNEGATAQFASGSWTYSAPAGFSQLAGIIHTPTVSKLSVDGAGVMTTAGIDITGFQLPQALEVAVSPDGATLLVADGGTSQQVKAFNTSDGSVKAAFGSSGTLGTLGGYFNSPAVTNTKFMFNGFGGGSGGGGAWIAYSSDGSFWLADNGNFRYLHFSAGNSPTYIEQIAYIPGGASWLCGNDDTKVFSFYHEFKIDYSKPLAPNNGSWTLVNNWANNGIIPQFPDQYGADRYTITGSNGKTYIPKPAGGSACTWYEKTSTGLRNTGVVANFNYVDENFNLWSVPTVNPFFGPVVGNYYKNPFTGFDGSSNPTWADNPANPPSRPFLSSVTLPMDFPAITDPVDANNPSNATQQLQNGNIVVFAPESGFGYHVAGLNPTTGAITFKTHQQVGGGAEQNTNFAMFDQGTVFPPAPYTVNATHPGGFECHRTGATDFFTAFRGEEWGNNQANVWSHWDQSGLLINRWGVAAPYFGQYYTTTEYPPLVSASTLAYLETIGGEDGGVSLIPQRAFGTFSFMGEPGMSGNGAWGGIAFQNGNYYIYHSDEFYHAGIHRWRVSNLASKQITSFPVSWNSSSYVPRTLIPYQFNSGLPFNTTNLPSPSGGWTRSSADFGTHPTAPFFRIYTNEHVCDPHLFPDLAFETNLNGMANNSSVSASYSWTRVGTGNWSLGGIWWQQGEGQSFNWQPPFPSNLSLIRNNTNVDVLDNAGKIIIRLYYLSAPPFVGESFWVNDVPIAGPYKHGFPLPLQFPLNQPALSIVANVGAGTMTVNYAGFIMRNVALYDLTANIHNPAQFRITSFITTFGDATRSLSFSNLQFADL